MPVPAAVARTADFLADCVASVDTKALLKKWGIKDKRYVPRLVQQLRQRHSLLPAPRSGRPRTYTDEQLAAGQQELSSPSQPYHSKQALVQHLKENGVLPAEATTHGYYDALKRHVAGQGLQLAYGTRSLQHALDAKDKRLRLAWCLKVQEVITKRSVRKMWFEDEKTVTSASRPRGERAGEGGLWLWCTRRPATRAAAGCRALSLQHAFGSGWPSCYALPGGVPALRGWGAGGRGLEALQAQP